MKSRLMSHALLLTLAMTGFVRPALAQNFSAEDLARRTIERRAIEAVIWSIPIVNSDMMFQSFVRNGKGGVNQIAYWSKLPDWKNQTLTPNPDTVYFMPFFSTKNAGR